MSNILFLSFKIYLRKSLTWLGAGIWQIFGRSGLCTFAPAMSFLNLHLKQRGLRGTFRPCLPPYITKQLSAIIIIRIFIQGSNLVKTHFRWKTISYIWFMPQRLHMKLSMLEMDFFEFDNKRLNKKYDIENILSFLKILFVWQKKSYEKTKYALTDTGLSWPKKASRISARQFARVRNKNLVVLNFRLPEINC